MGKNKFKRKKSELSKYPLSMQEVSRLINASKTLRDKVIVGSAYHIGLRRFEIAKMMKNEINFEKGRITVKGKGKKTSNPSTISF